MSAAMAGASSLWAADQAAPPSSSPAAPPSPWSVSASVSAKESFDDNVYLQSVTSNANRQSIISTVIPAVAVAYKPSGLFNAAITYAPEINVFDSDSSENNILHRTSMALGGRMDQTSWDVAQSLIFIEGNADGPTWTGPGGAPAGGGIPIRDRREAVIERGQFRVTQTIGQWFVRPVLSGYFHDFETDHKTTAGYQNYVNRNDLNGGVDLGYEAAKSVWLVAGYRYGVQNQAQLFSAINPEHYDNTYHRVLFGSEGKVGDWLTLAVSAGPEFRYYDGIVASGFDRNELYAYSDTTITVTPTKTDSVTFLAKRFEQPAFGGRATYIDTTYDLSWRHQFTDKFTMGIGGRGYNLDFKPSSDRNDWILTAYAVASYVFNPHLSAEASYAYNDGESLVPNTAGRQFTQNLLAVGLKYVFQ